MAVGNVWVIVVALPKKFGGVFYLDYCVRTTNVILPVETSGTAAPDFLLNVNFSIASLQAFSASMLSVFSSTL